MLDALSLSLSLAFGSSTGSCSALTATCTKAIRRSSPRRSAGCLHPPPRHLALVSSFPTPSPARSGDRPARCQSWTTACFRTSAADVIVSTQQENEHASNTCTAIENEHSGPQPETERPLRHCLPAKRDRSLLEQPHVVQHHVFSFEFHGDREVVVQRHDAVAVLAVRGRGACTRLPGLRLQRALQRVVRE